MPISKGAKKDDQWQLVASELEGLYREADKMCKKSPATKVSNLELEGVNYVIGLVKELLEGDLFIDRLANFEPAGDNPEYREIVVVLRQMIQGMNRHAPVPLRIHV